MSRTDRELLVEAMAHLKAARAHLRRGDMEDDIVADAVSLRLAAAVDVSARLSLELDVRAFLSF